MASTFGIIKKSGTATVSCSNSACPVSSGGTRRKTSPKSIEDILLSGVYLSSGLFYLAHFFNLDHQVYTGPFSKSFINIILHFHTKSHGDVAKYFFWAEVSYDQLSATIRTVSISYCN